MRPFKLIPFWALAVLVVLSACVAEKPLNFKFYDTSGAHYSSSSLRSDFKIAYGIDYEPAVVIIQANTADDPKLKSQDNILTNIEDVEERGIIYVGYSADGMYRDGYFIMPKEKPEFFAESGFHVYLISPNGKLLQKSTEPIPAKRIKAVFPERTSVR